MKQELWGADLNIKILLDQLLEIDTKRIHKDGIKFYELLKEFLSDSSRVAKGYQFSDFAVNFLKKREGDLEQKKFAQYMANNQYRNDPFHQYLNCWELTRDPTIFWSLDINTPQFLRKPIGKDIEVTTNTWARHEFDRFQKGHCIHIYYKTVRDTLDKEKDESMIIDLSPLIPKRFITTPEFEMQAVTFFDNGHAFYCAYSLTESSLMGIGNQIKKNFIAVLDREGTILKNWRVDDPTLELRHDPAGYLVRICYNSKENNNVFEWRNADTGEIVFAWKFALPYRMDFKPKALFPSILPPRYLTSENSSYVLNLLQAQGTGGLPQVLAQMIIEYLFAVPGQQPFKQGEPSWSDPELNSIKGKKSNQPNDSKEAAPEVLSTTSTSIVPYLGNSCSGSTQSASSGFSFTGLLNWLNGSLASKPSDSSSSASQIVKPKGP